jgi:hypothetical protein
VIGWEMLRGAELGAWIAWMGHTLNPGSLFPAWAPTIEGSEWLLLPLLATIALVSGAIVYLTTEKL